MAVTWKLRLVSHAMLQVQAPRSRDVAEDSQSVAVDPGASSQTWKGHVKAVMKFESHFFQNIGPLRFLDMQKVWNPKITNRSNLFWQI